MFRRKCWKFWSINIEHLTCSSIILLNFYSYSNLGQNPDLKKVSKTHWTMSGESFFVWVSFLCALKFYFCVLFFLKQQNFVRSWIWNSSKTLRHILRRNCIICNCWISTFVDATQELWLGLSSRLIYVVKERRWDFFRNFSMFWRVKWWDHVLVIAIANNI